MKPAISVAIATFNCREFLPSAIESVFAQTFDDWELIIVDDGSTDGTAEVVRPFLADPRVRYYERTHEGHAPAKNFGARQSQGDWIAFLDADDVWLPQKLERQLRLAIEDPEIGVIYSRIAHVDPDGRRLDVPELRPARGYVLRELLFENFVGFSSAMVRRDVFEEAGPFDPSIEFPIDYQLWLHAALRYRFDYVDETMVHYRTGHSNMSERTTGVNRRAQIDQVVDRFLSSQARGAFSDEVLRAADARRCCRIALERRDDSRTEALVWYLRALKQVPVHGAAWYGLASLGMPEVARRMFRRMRNQPPDWRVPPLAKATNDV